MRTRKGAETRTETVRTLTLPTSVWTKARVIGALSGGGVREGVVQAVLGEYRALKLPEPLPEALTRESKRP